MKQLLQKKPLTIFGDGAQTRAFSHVSDVAPYIANSVNVSEAYNHTFNIGGDDFTSVKDLATNIGDTFNQKEALHFLEARNEVVHAYADHAKFKKIFKPKLPTTLEKGLAEMAEWAKQQVLKPSKGFNGIEIEKKLPASWKNHH